MAIRGLVLKCLLNHTLNNDCYVLSNGSYCSLLHVEYVSVDNEIRLLVIVINSRSCCSEFRSFAVI